MIYVSMKLQKKKTNTIKRIDVIRAINYDSCHFPQVKTNNVGIFLRDISCRLRFEITRDSS